MDNGYLISIRIQFPFVPAFVFENYGVIFPIVGILFFMDGVNATPVFPIAMRMVHLRLACL